MTLVASSVEHVWEIKSRESYLNASFGDGSALTHYSFVLSDFSMMNWTLYGSNDRSTWLLLDIRKLHDSERSTMTIFSIFQPYPIGGMDLQNSGAPSSSIFPWILTHIPGMPAPIPFISSKNSSSVRFEHFGSFTLSVWINPLRCNAERCIPLMITDRSVHEPVVFFELIPVSISASATQMFAFRVCSIVQGISRCSSTAQLGTLIHSGSFHFVTVTFELASKAMRLFLNGKAASHFINDFFFGLNISNFVVGHGYTGRVNDVDIRPYVMNVADLSFPFAASGNDFRAVLLQLGDNMQVSVRVRGVQRVSFGLESNEFRLLQLYSNISRSLTGSALFNFTVRHESDYVSYDMAGTATVRSCRNHSYLSCSFSEADVFASPGSSHATLRFDFNSGGMLTLPLSLYSSILVVHHQDVSLVASVAQIFLSGTIWNVKYSGIDSSASYFAALHGSKNMVVFPCRLQPNASMLSCNSSGLHRISTSHYDNQVLWQPIVDASIDVSIISTNTYQHVSFDLQGERKPQTAQNVSRILSLSVFEGSSAEYGVVVKFSERLVSVVLVYQDHPSPRMIEVEFPGIPSSCLSHTYVTRGNSKFLLMWVFS